MALKQSTKTPYLRVAVWGDSIVWGASDCESGGWVELLKQCYLKMELGQVYNRGISGLRTDHLLKVIKSDAAVIKPDIVVLGIGVNDSKHPNKVSLRAYRRNLTKIVKIISSYTSKILFLGLTRINESKLVPPPNGERPHSNKAISSYDKVLKSFCRENRLPYLAMDQLVKRNDLADGLHPNTKGHQKIFQRVAPIIRRMLAASMCL